MKNFRKRCLRSMMALCLIVTMNQSFPQVISPDLCSQNAWMPDTIGTAFYNGKLHKNWLKVEQSGAKMIRFGGISTDKNKPTNYQYIKMIDSIRTHGMEPIIQVPFNNYQYSAQTAAGIVQYINVTMGRNVKYWSIGNEPDLKYGFTSASQVAPYLKSFASAMKAVDPTIKIMGPECAWFNKTILDGLTSPGGSYDVTGKDANGRYYLDFITFHSYPFSGSQTRSQVITKLMASGGYNDNLAYLKSRINNCNTYHNRTGTSAVKMALTEGNIAYKDATGDGLYGVGTNSFIGGQFVAEMICIGMKKGLDIFNMWSIIEGSSGGTTNIGYIDPSTGNKKPTYHHFKMLADNFSGNYANGTSNITNVKAFGSKNSQQICVLLMNQDQTSNYNYTLRLNTGTVSGSNPLKININASVAQEYSDVLPKESSVLLTFNTSGAIIKKCVYGLSTQAANNQPPSCTTFSSQDTNPPVVSTFNPADNSTNISKSANLVITFNESIKKGTGNILIKESGAITQTIDVTNVAITVSGNTATINPGDFTYGASVNIEMASGVFKDSSNNNYAGISGVTAWNFSIETEPDKTSPTVISYNPPDNSVNVAKSGNLTLTFSEPILKGSGNILIKENGLTTQTLSVLNSSITVSGNTATMDPVDFSYGVNVSVEIQAGAFKDTATNIYAGILDSTMWNFSTVQAPDILPPLVTQFTPADNAKNVYMGTNLTIKFNEPIQKGNGNITIKENGNVKQIIPVMDSIVTVSGNTVIINPADFSNWAIVSIEMDAGVIEDTFGNIYAGIYDATTWNFRVRKFNGKLFPAMNDRQIDPDALLRITFESEIVKGCGKITILENGIEKQVIDISDPGVSIFMNTVTIAHEPFNHDAEISIEIPENAFTDSEGENQHIDNHSNWAFSTGSTSLGADDNSSAMETDNSDIRLYPNPSKGQITLELSGSSGEINTLIITNAAGQEIIREKKSFSDGRIVIELDKLFPNGMYVIQLFNGNSSRSQKFILDR